MTKEEFEEKLRLLRLLRAHHELELEDLSDKITPMDMVIARVFFCITLSNDLGFSDEEASKIIRSIIRAGKFEEALALRNSKECLMALIESLNPPAPN